MSSVPTNTLPGAAAPVFTWHASWSLRSREPIRVGLYGQEALAAEARQLAADSQDTFEVWQPGPLLRRLRQNSRVLARAYQRLVTRPRHADGLSPEAEWLLDNFYIIEGVLRDVHRNLPRGYYRELPRLRRGPLTGYPRVYALALALIAHTDSSLDEERITRFVQVYQAVTPLTIGELWAVPTMLRMGLLENLRRLAGQMLAAGDDRARAERWVAPLLAGGQPARLRAEQLTEPFIARALELLRNASAPAALAQAERYFAARGRDGSEAVRAETQRQAANQVSVGNCITSLRLLSALDWGAFFERTNVIDPLLAQDPAGVYSAQDFATRDRYRQAVERLARGSRCTELEVARRALALAHRGQELDAAPRGPQSHVGYYLIGPGADRLRQVLGYRPRVRQRLVNAAVRRPAVTYFGTVAGLTILLLFALGMITRALFVQSPVLGVLVLLAALLPVSELAIAAANYLLTLLLPPRVLPKLEFKNGIPGESATFVVIPTLLSRPQSAAGLLQRLEIHYLANPDSNLYFALLTDFTDAAAEHLPADEACLRAALQGVEALNRRHAGEGPPRFYVIHRGRRWNPVQGCWMGWERKRGKLAEFNRLLRGLPVASPLVCSGDVTRLPRIRFVITLDQDTQLPHTAARRLIGTLAHPLNQPRFDAASGRVAGGYGVLQPRVSFHLASARRSWFSRIHANSAGLSPYVTAVSDVYQDLFGSGTFTGKGIYDIDAFEAATEPAFPENAILSHDLIEGNFARCGAVSDIELYDDFPARYHAYARREHRWIRGDWQLLPWLGRRVPVAAADGAAGPPGLARGWRPNPLPLLERWKIFDNLRRSLVAPALVAWLLLGWTVLPLPAWLVSGLAVLVVGFPLVLHLAGMVRALCCGTLEPVRELRGTLPATCGQVGLALAFLPYQAYLTLDAIVRTLSRLYVSHRHLLEWETAASAEKRLGNGFKSFWSTMGPTALLAAGLTLLLLLFRPEMLLSAWLLPVTWALAPLLAFAVSQDVPDRTAPLTSEERGELRRLARRTWLFFETFVGPEDNWLAPDNYQEDPGPIIAHRTSPTNQGLLLLSTLTAHDLGYLGLGRLLDRLEGTFAALDRLERFRGHFYNWYDTRTLQPLQPTYVSTVDSGNLAACLVTVKQALEEKLRAPILGPEVAAGLADTLGQVEKAGERLGANERAALAAVHRQLDDIPTDLPGWDRWLAGLHGEVSQLETRLRSPETPDETADWLARLLWQIEERQQELRAFAPWLTELAHQPATAPAAWESAAARLRARLSAVFRPAEVAAVQEQVFAEVQSLEQAFAGEPACREWLAKVRQAVGASAAGALVGRARALAERAEAFAAAMDFWFLYKRDRHLFAIGYHVPQQRLDAGCYDLLASEARLTSYLAIARGAVPAAHWFHLGRLLTRVEGRLCLLSWGGTMFEYLMPPLLLRGPAGTLLEESCLAAVDAQVAYGRKRGVPWGMSESAFASRYASGDYQYQAFGVPGLGLKRGLGRDLVVAPYATALALPFRPHEAVANFRRLAAEGASGRYGFYESIDYTPTRVPAGARSVVVRCFMAHHQGMTLLALANCLLGNPWPRRFGAEPMVRATELLMQEKVPRAAEPMDVADQEPPAAEPAPARPRLLSRRVATAETASPRTHLLSNGEYLVMVTNAGSGFSRWRGLDVTRWREDVTRDDAGQALYVRDVRTGRYWSVGHQPVGAPADFYEVTYSADKAEFHRVDGPVASHLEITVAPENPAEVRRLLLTNQGPELRELEVTSYLELALAAHRDDAAHPAFWKLFLETEWVPAYAALLCRRRRRAPAEPSLWAVHVASSDGPAGGEVQFETDRARFLGRGRSPAGPAALDPGARLSGTTGPVLDPIFSLRRRVRLAPGASVSILFCTAVASSREQALALADHYRQPQTGLRDFELAWARAQGELRQLRLSTEELHRFQRLASHLIYAGPALRAPAEVLAANDQGVEALWRQGISGDRPILVCRVRTPDDVKLVQELLAAHTYWRSKAFEVDLLILTEQPGGYLDAEYRQVLRLIELSGARDLLDKPGGVFVHKAADLAGADLRLLLSAARVVLEGGAGSLEEQLERAEFDFVLPPPLVPRAAPRPDAAPGLALPGGLAFANGLGGFTAGGAEYCILPYRADAAGPGQYAPPPAPWVNVVANPQCGFLVSESGLGATWVGNSQLNRLTPWYNDPVSDPPAEVVYLRDEQTGEVWTPTPLPLGAGAATLVRHGQGYTRFERRSHGLTQDLLVFVPPRDPVKIIRLALENHGDQPRELSATFYAEWVLGTLRENAAAQVRTEWDDTAGAVLAFNPFNRDFPQAAFAAAHPPARSFTADRTQFLGRNGSPAAPAALRRTGLSGRVGPALDPCAALQVKVALNPGEKREVMFFLGTAADRAGVGELLRRYRGPEPVGRALDEIRADWDRLLSTVQVQTPDPALDLLMNRWLLYQVLACRLWGRSAYYQSGGAFGFRDQLQDVLALLHADPAEARAHLLRSAGRQFREGDVQHWWHPPAGRGVRTRCSDDYLWLPFAVAQYVAVTGDRCVLDESAPFLVAPPLQPGQREDYGLPAVGEAAPLYEHCVRALEHGLRFGPHGLPLIGTGDWNDGMNEVGPAGRGESVWLGWFLHVGLQAFADLADQRGDTARAASWREHAERVHQAVEQHGWDGQWYRRAYFDDGMPLGSARNVECQIDSLPQSWAVISGAAEADRARQAMHAVYEQLVRPEDGLVLLFTPPFDEGKLDPGYVRGYVPGVRENGGQYTHAAAWVVQAAALLGEGNGAGNLLRLLNPLSHASTPGQVARYRVEPYVLAGDVYSQPPHVGRGGWTWYTGAAGWFYRVVLENVLGVQRRGNRFRLEPCVPGSCQSFAIIYRHGATAYHITVENPGARERGVATVLVDGQPAADGWVELRDDHGTHEVRVVMG